LKPFSDIAREITQGESPIFTVKQAAAIMRVHEQTFYSYMNDHTEPSYSRLVDLSREAARKGGYFTIAMQMFPPCYGVANGKVEDDLLKMYEYGTDLHRAFKEGEKAAAQKAIERMRAEIRDLEAEVNRL